MTEQTSDSGEPPPSRVGCLFAAALVFAPFAIYALAGGPELSYEFFPLLLFGISLALPFGYVALEGTKAWLPWLVVIGLTIVFWGATVGYAIIGARNQIGVPIALGLVIFAFPIVITVFAWAAVQHTRRR